MTSHTPAGLACPGCGHAAQFTVGDRQAFCGNDGCKILMWDPAKSIAELADDMQVIDLDWTGGGDDR
jgi:hypothetical protein